MIGRADIEQILAQYAKHGWTLRRVLLSEKFRRSVPDFAEIFEGVDVSPSEVDAAWFSRSSRPEITAWELRHLAETPYALVENIRDTADGETLESRLKQSEIKMAEAIKPRTTGN